MDGVIELPEAEGGGDEGKGEVAHDGDEGDVADRQQTDHHRPKHHPRLLHNIFFFRCVSQPASIKHRSRPGIGKWVKIVSGLQGVH